MYLNSFTERITIGAVFLCMFATGCSEPPVEERGPTYAELVATYNAELALLDRLEKKKQELISQREAVLRPPPMDTLSALQGLLGSAAELGNQLDPNASPDDLLDQVAERAEATEKIGAQLLDALASDGAEDTGEGEGGDSAAAEAPEPDPRQQELTDQFNRDLAALEAEIAKQRVRVARARAARDAAEVEAAS